MEDIIFKVALIGLLGIGAQWLAWRLALPAIVMMSAAGLLAGPGLGLIDPANDFGGLLSPMISVAVAVILFEGGLSLNLTELRHASQGVRRLILPGAPVAWGLGALAAHGIAGLSWPVAILFSGILVVTGPTVVIPLLRQARLSPRPRAVLKWEGIVNDPIGALLAVLVYEYLAEAGSGHGLADTVAWIIVASLSAIAIGFVLGRGIAWVFRRGRVPDFLKAPVILSAVLACFEAANLILDEAGLLAVTAMGMTLANARIPSLTEMRRFKETIAIILVSGVFVVLTATLTRETLLALDWRAAGFVAAMLFVVRPAAVSLSMLSSDVPWRERLLIGWIAPRGVVAVAVSGLFASSLVGLGYEEAAVLVPLSFAMVFATVIAHGFTVGPLARLLNLVSAEKPGILIVGASPWSLALAQALNDLKVPVTMADTSWNRLRAPRLAGIPVYFGEILSEATEHRIDIQQFSYLIAATGNEAYNALVSTEFAAEFSRSNVFQLGREAEDDPYDLPFTLKGRQLFTGGITLDELLKKYYQGWTFQKSTLTEAFTFEAYMKNQPQDAEIMLIKRHSDALTFPGRKDNISAGAGDTLLSYAPPITPVTPGPATS